MYIFSCEHSLEAMLTCIYEAWACKAGHQNIRLQLHTDDQISLFDQHRYVEADKEKAEKVMNAIICKISPAVYREIAYCSMSYEEDVLDNMYRVLLLGFHFGPNVLSMTQYKDVMRNKEIRLHLGNESHHFREFIRFHEVKKGLYVAHIEPKSRLVVTLGPSFEDRMPSEHWIIVDDIHKEAVIHPKNEHFYLRQLSDEEFGNLLKTEECNDNYTDLWQIFFDSIAIKERKNTKCQNTLFPIWTRKHAVEFMNSSD